MEIHLSKPSEQSPKKPSYKKTVIIVAIVAIAIIIVVISLLWLVVLPFSIELGRSLLKLSEKNLRYTEAMYNPAFNVTIVKFDNIGGKTLYNITVVSEFGEIQPFPLEVNSGLRFQIGLTGKCSKATVQYATEPNGIKEEEDFEWNW